MEWTVLKTQSSLNDLQHDLGGRMDTLDCKLDSLSRSVGESVDSLLGEMRMLRGELLEIRPVPLDSVATSSTTSSRSVTHNTGQDRGDVGSNSCVSGSDLGRSQELSQESSECDKDDESSRDMVLEKCCSWQSLS